MICIQSSSCYYLDLELFMLQGAICSCSSSLVFSLFLRKCKFNMIIVGNVTWRKNDVGDYDVIYYTTNGTKVSIGKRVCNVNFWRNFYSINIGRKCNVSKWNVFISIALCPNLNVEHVWFQSVADVSTVFPVVALWLLLLISFNFWRFQSCMIWL